MDGTASANNTVYRPVGSTGVDELEVQGSIHPGEAQPESEEATTSVAHMENAGEEEHGDIEGDGEADTDEKYGLFRNPAARQVWSEYMRLMAVSYTHLTLPTIA